MTRTLPLLMAATLWACKDTEKPDEINENEVITTVELSLVPISGAPLITARWADPENDGSPIIDEILLSEGEDYTLAVSFLNELEDPPEDITLEVDAESDQHQVFYTGSAIDSAVDYTYDDLDLNGFPVGLEGTLSTLAAGGGDLVVTLRHVPPENGAAVKTGTLAEQAATGGISSLPGDTDAEVTFALTVQ